MKRLSFVILYTMLSICIHAQDAVRWGEWQSWASRRTARIGIPATTTFRLASTSSHGASIVATALVSTASVSEARKDI